MKTQEYQVMQANKIAILKAAQVVEVKLQQSLAAKKARKAAGTYDDAFKAAHKALRAEFDAHLVELKTVNAALRDYRNTHVVDEPKVAGKKRGPRQEVVKNLAELKAALTKKGVAFTNRGILLQVADKKVTFNSGKFYVNKQAVEPTAILAAI